MVTARRSPGGGGGGSGGGSGGGGGGRGVSGGDGCWLSWLKSGWWRL